MAYADYAFYTATYGGASIEQSEFARLINQASAYIDALTFDRAGDVEDAATLTKLKYAACAAAETIKKQEQGGELQSERVGNFAVTYADTPTARLSIEAKITQAVKIYLSNTELLYRGFASGEYGGVLDED